VAGVKAKGSPEAAEMRQQAEERLQGGAVTYRSPQPLQSREAVQGLVHELEVHQIELEMQNEELRRACDELQVSQNMYEELYDFAPISYFIFDTGGLILGANLKGSKLMGIERRQLIRKTFSSFIADAEGRDAFSGMLAQALCRKEVQRSRITVRNNAGKLIHGLFQAVGIGKSAAEDAHVFCSIVDETLRVRLTTELQTTHENLELTVQERTRELTSANLRLSHEIEEHKKAKDSLQTAFTEIQLLKDRLQAENTYLLEEVGLKHNFDEIIGQSKPLEQVFHLIEQVARMNATVLLLGETGTGKGIIARATHSLSARKDRAMITVNCTSLPANLIESELFGREKGAFTGSNARQIGRFELADGGTVFLDEIGEMPLELQSKLLRVIQDGEFERLGSPRTIKIDVRIIAASNRNLEEEIKHGRFREDLFYRLNVFPITIPPLRQRKDDIPLLVQFFINKFNKKIGKKISSVTNETLDILQDYHWPGNIRELESVIERAVILSQGSVLQVLDRFDTFRKDPEKSDEGDIKALADLEQHHILQVLNKTGWRIEGKNGAAKLLGLNPSTLRARMRKHGITRQ